MRNVWGLLGWPVFVAKHQRSKVAGTGGDFFPRLGEGESADLAEAEAAGSPSE